MNKTHSGLNRKEKEFFLKMKRKSKNDVTNERKRKKKSEKEKREWLKINKIDKKKRIKNF